MSESFFYKKEDGLYLYGAASIGKIQHARLTERGFKINGFIDKRANEMSEYCTLPVFAIDDEKADKNVLVLVAVKNVFEHGRIAELLYKNGYNKILYRPFDCLNAGGLEWERKLNDLYSEMTEGDALKLNGAEIPFYSEEKLFCADSVKIGEPDEDGFIRVIIPVTMLFTDKDKYGEAVYSVLFLKPHINFIHYVMGKGGNKEDYLEFCMTAGGKLGVEMTDAWKENVIANRAEVFGQMAHKYYAQPDFFIHNAPRVEWDEQERRFNLVSGKHRGAFLAAMDANYITVKTTVEDYRAFLKTESAEKFFYSFADKIQKGTFIPVENPYYYEYSSCSEQFWFNLIRAISKALRERYYKGYYEFVLNKLNALVDIDDYGFVKRFFARLGCKVYSDKDKPIENALDDMLGKPFLRYNGEKLDVCVCGKADLDKYLNKTDVCIVISNEKADFNEICRGVLNGKEIYAYLIRSGK